MTSATWTQRSAEPGSQDPPCFPARRPPHAPAANQSMPLQCMRRSRKQSTQRVPRIRRLPLLLLPAAREPTSPSAVDTTDASENWANDDTAQSTEENLCRL